MRLPCKGWTFYAIRYFNVNIKDIVEHVTRLLYISVEFWKLITPNAELYLIAPAGIIWLAGTRGPLFLAFELLPAAPTAGVGRRRS
jgi:hypothetical protein